MACTRPAGRRLNAVQRKGAKWFICLFGIDFVPALVSSEVSSLIETRRRRNNDVERVDKATAYWKYCLLLLCARNVRSNEISTVRLLVGGCLFYEFLIDSSALPRPTCCYGYAYCDLCCAAFEWFESLMSYEAPYFLSSSSLHTQIN